MGIIWNRHHGNLAFVCLPKGPPAGHHDGKRQLTVQSHQEHDLSLALGQPVSSQVEGACGVLAEHTSFYLRIT